MSVVADVAHIDLQALLQVIQGEGDTARSSGKDSSGNSTSTSSGNSTLDYAVHALNAAETLADIGGVW